MQYGYAQGLIWGQILEKACDCQGPDPRGHQRRAQGQQQHHHRQAGLRPRLLQAGFAVLARRLHRAGRQGHQGWSEAGSGPEGVPGRQDLQGAARELTPARVCSAQEARPLPNGRGRAFPSSSACRASAARYRRAVAVDRLLPTEEARDLIALTRDFADNELLTRVEACEKNETYPDGLFAKMAEVGLLGLPYPEEWGGGGQPYEVYLQVLEELARPLGRGRGGDQRAGPLDPPGAQVRHARPAGAVAAGDARRPADRRLQPVRTAGRVGRRRADLQGREDRDRVPRHRHQGLDHPRRDRRLLRAVRPHRRGLARDLLLPRPGPGARACPSAGPRRRWACTRSPPRTPSTTASTSTRTG